MKLNNKGFTLVEGLLVAVLVGVVSFGGYYVLNENSNKLADTEETNEVMPESTDNDAVGSNDEPTVTDGLLEYSNEELGYSFLYPEDWGTVAEVSVSEYPDAQGLGEGKVYSTSFSDNKYAYFGGATTDYTFPAGGGLLSNTNKGWVERGGMYYIVVNKSFGNEILVESPEIIQGVNAEAVLVTNEASEFLGNAGYITASFNTPSVDFGGVAFGFEIPRGTSEAELKAEIREFRELLTTVEIL